MNNEFIDKKEGRKKRKFAQKQDRSKYKKSVREKHELKRVEAEDQRVAKKELKRGRVVTIFPEKVLVYYQGKTITCTTRGVLKKERLEAKNLIVVGDFVHFSEEGAIWQVEKRKSVLSRINKNKAQLIAANLDLVLITTTTQEPLFDIAYLDRALIATVKGNMKPVIVLNKVDLGISPLVQEFIKVYSNLKIPIIQTSTKTGVGIELLKKKMKNHASVFTGLSGVGKSSLINEIMHLDLETAELSEKNQRGRHTTTRSSLLHLEFGGFCIDTPGIQNFCIAKLTKEELDDYFFDIAHFSTKCKFFNCTHSHEPECAVKKACEEGKLSSMRLHSYTTITYRPSVQ